MYSPLQHLDWASLTYHSLLWSAANFRKPKQLQLLLPLCLFLPYTMPPIQRSFSLLLPPSPNSLSLQPLLCRPHTWRVESRPIWQAQVTTKKGKKRGEKVVFWPRKLLCVFIWREQANLFSFHHEPKGMAMDPKASHSHKSALTKIRGWYFFWTHRHLWIGTSSFFSTSFQPQAPVKNISFYKVGLD